jgi:PAS domain S-box-containing protein
MTELLKQSEMQFRAMNDAAFDPIFLVSASGFFVYANQAAQDLLGYGVNEFPALKFTGITSVCGMEDAAAGTMSSGADILSGDAYRSRQETLFVTKDGTLVNVEITTGRVSINSTIYTVITARDNTLRINEEKSRLKLEKIQKTFETQIDNTLLQGRIPDNLDGVSIGRFMISSGNLNGDFTEFIVYDNRHADILLGDVMGHGMLSALVGAGLKSRYLKMLAQQKKRGCDDIPELLDVMRDLHDDCIGNLIDLEIYVTLLLVRIDLEEMRFSMIDCGHTPTIHYQAGSDRCKLVKGPNPAVGMVERQEYRQVSFPLEEKDMIVLYSDGITESRMPDGSFFGQERLLDLVLQNKCCSPVAMAETIRTSVLTETGSENVEDDVTCIVIRIGSSTE